jgi:hypothetical protein
MKLRNKINALVLGLAFLFTAGCGEKDEHQDDPTPVKATQGTCLLTGEGSNNQISYTYNTQGEMVQLILSGVHYKNLSYNAAGDLSEIKTFDINTNALTQLETITYDSNNLPVGRFVRGTHSNGTSYTYQRKSYYNSAKQLIRQTHHFDDTVIVEKAIFSYPAADQVIVKNYAPRANIGYQLTDTDHMYLDNMKSPFLFSGYFWGESMPEHNPVKVVRTDHINNTTTTDYHNYVYNADGFPVSASSVSTLRPGMQPITNTWTYTCQ